MNLNLHIPCCCVLVIVLGCSGISGQKQLDSISSSVPPRRVEIIWGRPETSDDEGFYVRSLSHSASSEETALAMYCGQTNRIRFAVQNGYPKRAFLKAWPLATVRRVAAFSETRNWVQGGAIHAVGSVPVARLELTNCLYVLIQGSTDIGRGAEEYQVDCYVDCSDFRAATTGAVQIVFELTGFYGADGQSFQSSLTREFPIIFASGGQ